MQSHAIHRGRHSIIRCPVPQEFDHSVPSLSPHSGVPSLSPHSGVQSGVVEERERDRLDARLQPEPGRGVEVSGHDQAGECELPGRGVEVYGYDQAGECELPGRGLEVSGYDQAGECEPGW